MCHVGDWPRHKDFLQDTKLRKRLSRAASVIRALYLKFRQRTWDIPIVEVAKKDWYLAVGQGDARGGRGDVEKFFLKFPKQLVKDERDRNQVLCTWMSMEALAWMHDIIADLLNGKFFIATSCCLIHVADSSEDLDVEIEEVWHTMSDMPRQTRYFFDPTIGSIDRDWDQYNAILRITGKRTKTQWVIDITRPQYGDDGCYYEWVNYEKEHVEEVVAIYPFGAHKELMDLQSMVDGQASLDFTLVGIVAAEMNNIVRSCDSWAIRSILSENEQDFELRRQMLVKTVGRSLRLFVKRSQRWDDWIKPALKYEARHPGACDKELGKIMHNFHKTRNVLEDAGDKVNVQLTGVFGPEMAKEEKKGLAYCEDPLHECVFCSPAWHSVMGRSIWRKMAGPGERQARRDWSEIEEGKARAYRQYRKERDLPA
jgi:hypothetical protein